MKSLRIKTNRGYYITITYLELTWISSLSLFLLFWRWRASLRPAIFSLSRLLLSSTFLLSFSSCLDFWRNSILELRYFCKTHAFAESAKPVFSFFLFPRSSLLIFFSCISSSPLPLKIHPPPLLLRHSISSRRHLYQIN